MVQDAMDNVPKKDVTMMIGDWNAKIGKAVCKTNNINIHGLGIRNERGDKLESGYREYNVSIPPSWVVDMKES